METPNTNTGVKQVQELDEDVIYTIIRNVTKNQKVILKDLGGIEIPPSTTVNLRERFRKSQLADATHDIHHFISIGALEDMSGKKPIISPDEQKKIDITGELQKKVDEARSRDLKNEIMGSTSISRLEDILNMSNVSADVHREAKLRYMQVHGWVDDDGTVIEGATDHNNEPIISVDKWEFKTTSNSSLI